MSEKDDPEVHGGLLQVLPGIELRDWFAGQALAGGHAEHDAYDVADTVLRDRPGGAREAKRLSRLAEIGELAVKDWLGTASTINADLREAIEQYRDDYMRTKTDPAPESAPDDVPLFLDDELNQAIDFARAGEIQPPPRGTVAEGVLEQGAHPALHKVGARRNADNEHRDLAVLVRDANGEDELT